jgi:hypothetical protein
MIRKSLFESNYKNYYTIYKKYAANNFLPTNYSDATNLIALAPLCPGTEGACVYQARALYNSIFNYALSFSDCSGSTARIAKNAISMSPNSQWEINLYPNPASNMITIQSSTANDQIELSISDLSGRPILIQSIQLTDFFANTHLSLMNGAYIVTMINSKNEILIKKLVINE